MNDAQRIYQGDIHIWSKEKVETTVCGLSIYGPITITRHLDTVTCSACRAYDGLTVPPAS